MPKHLFVVNPIAGGGIALERNIRTIKETSEAAGLDYKIEMTRGQFHATVITANAAKTGDDYIVYACGGDGTLNEVANGAYGSENLSVTHYPCGTGNDFVKTMGCPDDFRILQKLITGTCREVDCIEMNSGMIALNICSVGVDANVAADVRAFVKFKALSSKMPYNLALLKNLVCGIHWPFQVELDGRRFDDRFAIITACNGRVYGGGFNACPDADPSDGKLEFLLARRVSRLKLAELIRVYAAGKYAEMPEYITHVQSSSIRILSGQPVNVNYDGETYKSTDILFAIGRHKLRFIVPSLL